LNQLKQAVIGNPIRAMSQGGGTVHGAGGACDGPAAKRQRQVTHAVWISFCEEEGKKEFKGTMLGFATGNG